MGAACGSPRDHHADLARRREHARARESGVVWECARELLGACWCAQVWERVRTWRAGPFSILWGVRRARSSLEACDERRRICWRSSTSCVRPAALSHEQLACVQWATVYMYREAR